MRKSTLEASEELKRERNWNPGERFQVIQETIAWAEQQAAVPRNSPVACIRKQARLQSPNPT